MSKLPPLLIALALIGTAVVPAAAKPRAGACAAAHVAVMSRATVKRARDATVCLLNRIRARHHLPPLRLDRRLARAARGHSREMVRHRYFAHESPNGAPAHRRIFRVHYVPRHASWSFGENIAWGGGSSAQPAVIVRMWMRSAPHRANILSRRFRDVGIGIAVGLPVRRHGRGATYTLDLGRHA